MILSHSEIALYQSCPRKYFYKYVKKRVSLVPSESLLRGKRIHAALADWWNERPLPRLKEPAERAMLSGYNALYQTPHLKYAATEVAFRVPVLPGLWIVGAVDVLGYDRESRQVIVEHKTTSSDIGAGGQYWKRVVLVDPQCSIYSLAFPGASVLYDVLRKPALRQKQTESEGDYEARCLGAMQEEPEKYFARFTVVRLEADARETIEDIAKVAFQMEPGANLFERHPHACFDYGSECEYFGACFEGRDIDGPAYTSWAGHEIESVAEERARA